MGFLPAGDQDDIVLQTFKQQQKAYRALLEGLKVGATSAHSQPGACYGNSSFTCCGKQQAEQVCVHACVCRKSRCP
jgi:hypothetical protein